MKTLTLILTLLALPALAADVSVMADETNGTVRLPALEARLGGMLQAVNPVVGTNGITVQGYAEVPTTNVLIFTAGDSQYWPEGTNWNGEYHLRPDNVYSNSANGKVWRFTGWTGPKSPGEPTAWIAGWHDGSGLAWWAGQYNPQLSEEGTGTVEGEPGFETYIAPTNTPTVAPWGSGMVNIGPGGSAFTIARGTTQELTTVTLTYDWATAIAAALEARLSVTGGVVSGTLSVNQFKVPAGTATMNLAIATNLQSSGIWNVAGTTKVIDPNGGSAAFSGAVTAQTFRATSSTLGFTGSTFRASQDVTAVGAMTGAYFRATAPRLAQFYRSTPMTNTIDTSYVAITNWSVAVTNGLTNSATAGTITITPGYWKVAGQFSFAGTANTTFEIVVFIGGAEYDRIECQRKLGAGGDVGSASFSGLIYTATNAVISARVKADGAADFILKYGSFTTTE